MKDDREWKEIRASILAEYRAMSYESLSRLVDEVNTKEIVGGSGTKYSVEVCVYWDGQSGGPVRVMCNIDDGGVSAFMPKSSDFIKAPDGSFVGE